MSLSRSDIKAAFSTEHKLFLAFASLIIICGTISTLLYTPVPMALPIGILYIHFCIQNPKGLYYLFFMILPFSVEISLGSLGTDLPSEPIMVTLLGIAILLFITNSRKLDKRIITHPISLLLLLHVSWIALTGLSSTYPLISLKYLIAKIWYVIPFYFLTLFLMKNRDDFSLIFSRVAPFLVLAILYVIANHAAKGFSFASSDHVVKPIFRNPVNYGVMLLIFVPYYVYLIKYKFKTWKSIRYMVFGILLIGIYFSYTRAAQLALVLAVVFYFIIRWRLLKLAIVATLIGVIGLVGYLSIGNKYMEYTPEFEKAITHHKFDNLLEATSKLEDVSTVERFYRWIAGAYMVKEKPLVGFGPSTFYSNYRAFTVNSFKTYVSDNPEKSGIHNNYLMIAVEQGIPGLLIMLCLSFIPLLFGERVYHLLDSPADKGLLIAAMTCHFLISITLFMNELLEADKIGPFYFLSTAIITFYAIQNEKSTNKSLT